MTCWRRRLGIVLAIVPALWTAASGAEDQGALVDGARREGRLNVASSAPGEGFPKLLQAFKAKYPFLDVTTGYYSAPTGRVLARVTAEIGARNVSFDIMQATNLAPYLDLAREGRLLRYDSPEYARYPDAAKAPGLWAAARVVGIVMAYNKNKLPEAAAPKSWADLLKPEFKGKKIAIQNAAAGTAFAQFYMLEKTLGVGYLKELAKQKPVIMATAGQVIDALVRGEVLVGATVDHWRAFEPDAAAAGVLPVYPEEGMPAAIGPVGIVAGAPHPNAAKLFMDFILSQEGQTLLNTELYRVYSMRADVPPPPGQRALAETKPLIPTDMADYERASADFPQHFESIFQ